MTGAIVADFDEPEALKDRLDFFGQNPDTSQSSITLEVQKSPREATSARRRRSWFGDSGGHRGGSIERSDVPQKPSSRRRHSLLGSSAPDLSKEKEPGTSKKSTTRCGFFGQSTKSANDTSSTAEMDDEPSERSESTISSRPTPTARRRSLLGSSTPTLDETIGRKPPRPTKSSEQSETSDNSQSLNSAETPPRIASRGVDRTKSLDGSPLRKERNKLNRGHGLGASWSFHSGDKQIRARQQQARSAEKDIVGSPGTPNSKTVRRLSLGSFIGMPASPGTPKTRKTVRRLSLGSLMGMGGNNNNETGEAEGTPKNSAPRRNSLTSAFIFSPPSKSRSNSDKTPSHGSPSHTSPKSDSTPPPPGPQTITNPYELVSKSRTKRGLPDFSRNMLMDTLAKQVAIDLAASNGNRCTPTSYHGNIGQGESIEKIHRTMMKQKGETARFNLLARHWTQIGIGIAKSKDGLIYMCQLFK